MIINVFRKRHGSRERVLSNIVFGKRIIVIRTLQVMVFLTPRSVGPTESLWTVANIRSICRMNADIFRRYPSLLDADCPSAFSLPGTIMEISGVSGCEAITQFDLVFTESRLRRCAAAYAGTGNGPSPLKACCVGGVKEACAAVPTECLLNDCAVFRLLYYHADKLFFPSPKSGSNFDSKSGFLKYSLTILPKTTSDPSKPLTKDLAVEELLSEDLKDDQTKILSMHENGLFNKVLCVILNGSTAF